MLWNTDTESRPSDNAPLHEQVEFAVSAFDEDETLWEAGELDLKAKVMDLRQSNIERVQKFYENGDERGTKAALEAYWNDDVCISNHYLQSDLIHDLNAFFFRNQKKFVHFRRAELSLKELEFDDDGYHNPTYEVEFIED